MNGFMSPVDHDPDFDDEIIVDEEAEETAEPDTDTKSKSHRGFALKSRPKLHFL